MKFITTTLAVMLLGTATAMAAPAAPTAEWANFVKGPLASGSMTRSIKATEDGSAIYWMGSAATHSAGDAATYADETIFASPVDVQRNTNNNLIIMRLDAQGKKVWSLYSSYGDAAGNNGGLDILPDGSIVFVAVMRHDVKADMLAHPLTIVDGTGASTDVYPAVDEYRNVGIVGHLSADGKLLGYGVIDVDAMEVPADGGTNKVRAGLFVDDLAVAPDGNIFISGNYRATMHLKDQAGNTVTFTPKYINGWNGDAQKAAGDMYLFKLTPEGQLLGSLEAQGTGITNGHINNVVYDSGILYLYGRYDVVSGEAFTATLAGAPLCSTGVVNLYVAAVDASTLASEWHTNIVGEKDSNNSCIMQNSGISVGNGNLWFCGQYNGKFYPQGNEELGVASTARMREGMLVKFDAATGKWVKGVSSPGSFSAAAYTGLTAYQDALINTTTPDKVYVFGYVMKNTVGVFLRPYNVNTLEADPADSWSLVTGVKGSGFNAAIPLAFNIAYAPKAGLAFTDARGKGGMCAAGLEAANTGSSFAIQIAKFRLPEQLFDGVSDIVADGDNAAVPVEYYDLQGRRVSDTPAAGLYIRRQGSQTTKVLVR